MAGMHEVDYKVFGEDIQFVEIELDPGEAAVAEAGGMFYMEDGITMETVFGDGSQQRTTFVDALIGAGKRLLVGESLFMTVFLNSGQGKKRVSFAAPYPGRIVPIKLSDIGGELITQKDSFLAAAKGVSIGIAFQKRFGVGFFGGEGFIMERLQGDGWAFVHAGGMLIEQNSRVRRSASDRYGLSGRACSRRSVTTLNMSARSSPRYSAAKESSSRRCAGLAVCGCNLCRLAAWLDGS